MKKGFQFLIITILLALLFSVSTAAATNNALPPTDQNGDGRITIADALTALRSMINSNKIPNRSEVLSMLSSIADGKIASDIQRPIKVVCVGDSITQGTGAKDPANNSYPARLQKLLGTAYRVVNCGKASA